MMCPECAQGKPRNCIGWTLDDNDREVRCSGVIDTRWELS